MVIGLATRPPRRKASVSTNSSSSSSTSYYSNSDRYLSVSSGDTSLYTSTTTSSSSAMTKSKTSINTDYSVEATTTQSEPGPGPEAVTSAITPPSAPTAPSAPRPTDDSKNDNQNTSSNNSNDSKSPKRSTSLPVVLSQSTSPTPARRAASALASGLSTTKECDYDSSPTELYQAIEAKQWQKVLTICESINDDDDSDRQIVNQAAVWVVRKEVTGRLRWRLLPLHAAIIFQAPFSVIEALLAAHLQAASCKDDQGMLPLHLALRNPAIDWSSVEELLTAYPAAVFVKDRKGRTPLEGGHAAAAKCAAEEGQSKNNGEPVTSSATSLAALQALELYTNIVVLGEKTKWQKSATRATEQRVAALQEQHAARLTEIRDDFEREQSELKRMHQEEIEALRTALEESKQRERQLLEEAQAEDKKLAEADDKTSTHRERSLKRQNRELRKMVQSLMSEQSNLAGLFEKLSREQKELDMKRNSLMHQFLTISEDASASSKRHVESWRNQVEETHSKFAEQLTTLGVGRCLNESLTNLDLEAADDINIARREKDTERIVETQRRDPPSSMVGSSEEKKLTDKMNELDRIALSRSADPSEAD